MTKEQADLWARIQAYSFDQIDAALPFSHRLSRDQNWTVDYTKKAIEEYKKFMFIICSGEYSCSPSEPVDEVWHLHLLYTKEYWKNWCAEVLRQDIHHQPTKGGKEERKKFSNWYTQTKRTYQHFFDLAPPTAIWPDAQPPLKQLHFRSVNTHQNIIIPKNKLIVLCICLFALPLFTFSTTEDENLLNCIVILIALFILFLIIIFKNRKNNGGGSSGGSGSSSSCGSGSSCGNSCGSSCGGGCG